MSINLHIKLLTSLLVITGLVVLWYKVTYLGLPLVPTTRADVWTIEARMEFKAYREVPVKLDLRVPRDPAGFIVVDENFVSGNYGLNIDDTGQDRKIQWAVRNTSGYQVLYYRLHLAPDEISMTDSSPGEVAVPDVKPDQFPEYMASAITTLVTEVRTKSADNISFAREMLKRLNAGSPDSNVELLHQDANRDESWIIRIAGLINQGNVPARLVRTLVLKDGLNHKSLTPWLEIHDGTRWVAINPWTGETGLPRDSLIWSRSDHDILELSGGKNARLEFSVGKHSLDMTVVAEQRARKLNSRMMEFSLMRLPVQTQNIYRILLMIPIGALLIVLLRNVVGVKTFGTFMPILIALAFRETELLWGLILFTSLISLGLLFRFYLEYLKLLLVPRLASVLIIVIMLMLAISVISYKLGFERGLSLALFPMVIITMSIERMSLVWEELGSIEAIKQGIGTLMVATLGYLLMSSHYIGHLVFTFPELLLIILAVTLLLGRYTGYRLTELWRFRMALTRFK